MFNVDVQPAVSTETKKIALYEAIGVVLLLLVYFVGHLIVPSFFPFDYKVIISAIIGGGFAVFNFFWMGLAIQKLTAATDKELAKKAFQNNYKFRLLVQVLWGVLAFALPCFNGIAGVIPLLFPSPAIKLAELVKNIKNKKKGDGKA